MILFITNFKMSEQCDYNKCHQGVVRDVCIPCLGRGFFPAGELCYHCDGSGFIGIPKICPFCNDGMKFAKIKN